MPSSSSSPLPAAAKAATSAAAAGALVQKEVRISRVTTLSGSAAQALNDPVRVKILEIIAHKPMSAEEIAAALGSYGHKKATTTVRHHLDTLRHAGLAEASRIVEVRGAVMKFYAPTIRSFSYEAPSDLDGRNARLIEDTSSKLLKILKAIAGDRKFAAGIGPKNACGICKGDHYKEFLAIEIINAALAQAMGRKEYTEIMSATAAAAGHATSTPKEALTRK